MIRKLKTKFTLITMSFVTVILLAVLACICILFAQNVRRQSDMALEMALSRPQGGATPNFQIGMPMPEGYHRDPIFVVSVSAEGQVELLMSERIEVDETELRDIVAAVQAAGDNAGTLSAYNLRYRTEETPGGVRIAFVDISLEKQTIGNVVLVCGIAGVLALAAFFAVSLLLARWTLKPVEQAWTQQRQFVSDASHELKTPLTVILANTEILKAHPDDTLQSQMKWVENTGQEARRMKGLVDDLLFLAKSDDVGESIVTGDVPLSDTVAHTALLFESKAFEQGVSVAADIAPGIVVPGNEAQLKQLTGILLDNAIKYSAPGEAVHLTLAPHHGLAQLSVHNRGNVISPEERRHLFERFYRADISRASDGYGLGLSIAKTITDAHKGKITVESSESDGTAFRVLLPIR